MANWDRWQESWGNLCCWHTLVMMKLGWRAEINYLGIDSWSHCRFDSRVKWWIHVSSIVPITQKLLFYCAETVANNDLNCRCVVVFDRLGASVVPTLNTAFSLTNVHAKWWIHCLLISSTPLLSRVTSIYDRPKWVCGVFWCFQGQLLNLDDLSVQHHLCLYNHV